MVHSPYFILLILWKENGTQIHFIKPEISSSFQEILKIKTFRTSVFFKKNEHFIDYLRTKKKKKSLKTTIQVRACLLVRHGAKLMNQPLKNKKKKFVRNIFYQRIYGDYAINGTREFEIHSFK